MAFLDNSGVVSLVADLQAKIKSTFAAKSHTHSADDVNRGILNFYRIPTGTTSTTVALGSHTHTSTLNAAGSVMASTAVEAGDKIVISDSSDYLRLKRSGIAFGSDTTTFLRNDGQWAAAGGVSMSTATASLPTSGWSSDSITVNVTGVTASNNVIVAPAPASVSAYAEAGIVCTAQGAGTLTFTRTSANTAAITVNVLILE